MGQLSVVYQANSEFMAIAVRDELAAHGIVSVQLLNEIPMRPGFTFEARPWAEVLVREHDLPRAREVVDGVALVMDGGETAAAYPPVIKFNTTTWFSVVWISLLVFQFTLLAASTFGDLDLNTISSPWGIIAWFAADVVLGIAFIILNWRMLGKQTVAAVGGLLALPVIVAWISINALPWLVRESINTVRWLIREAIRYGSFNVSNEE